MHQKHLTQVKLAGSILQLAPYCIKYTEVNTLFSFFS